MNNYKQLYKTSKISQGKLHPQTLYYWFMKSPILMPYIIIFATLNYIILGITTIFISISNLLFYVKFFLYASKNQNEKVSDVIKPIALYLPQYHEIPENDEWWGKGFTEWTNVKKAVPLFEGHYQPHVPHKDVGYYDLSDVNVMKKQAKMAKEYGVYGFCFYYYHFKDGKRLLEKPINNYLNAKDIDFPFCFSWANENWTRVWDGGEKNVIMPQDYGTDNMANMIKDMLSAFKDSRYIKVGNKPVLLVYRPEIIPEIYENSKLWKQLVVDAGFDDLYLISMQNFAEIHPKEFGFDAATEFAPKNKKKKILSKWINIKKYNKINKPIIIKYFNVLKTLCKREPVNYIRYKSVCPSWDNSARRGTNAPRILINTSKQYFTEFYKNAVKETLITKAKDTGFVFINAWNEWGEGTHLEPDEKYGYDNLEVIKNIQEKELKEL